jgi:hypothetical protein
MGLGFLNGCFGTSRRAIGKMGSALKNVIHSQILDIVLTQGKVAEMLDRNKF